MHPPSRGWSALASAALFLLLTAAPALAQKTDVITLANGDRITGEIKVLERGRVEFSTDDMGTIYLEWDKVVTMTSIHVFEVGTHIGRRYLGRLGAAPDRSVSVLSILESVTLPVSDVTEIRPIGRSFWNKLDGSIDIGFNYTRSSEIAQLNLNASTIYRRPSFEARLNGSGTVTWTENGDSPEEERDDRGTMQASYTRYRRQRAFVGGTASLETNDSLGLELRTQAAAFGGYRWVNSNRAQIANALGLAVNNEQGVDTEATQNIEAVMTLLLSYFTYDRPKTNIDLNFTYYPSLSDFGRQRIQFDSNFKREIWKDVYLSLNVFDTFDSRPPNDQSQRNDIGIVFAFGLTY